MLDRVTSMQVFARVAAFGSLSAAARALGMSQTMASKHMAALEERLGVKLLHRTTRRIRLNEAGRRYLEAVERILAEIEDADAAASDETTVARGVLRLNAPVSFGIRELAPLLPELCDRHPELTVDLGLNDRYVDPIEEGWDLVVRIGTMKDSRLVGRRLASCRMLVCASPDYLAKHGVPRRVADLADHNCMRYTLSTTFGASTWPFLIRETQAAGGTVASARETVTVAIDGDLKVNNGDALVAAAAAGQGVVYQPTFLLADEIRDGLLTVLDLDHEPIEIDGVYALYPPDRRPPAKVRAAIDFLVERFSPIPPWERRLAAAPGSA